VVGAAKRGRLRRAYQGVQRRGIGNLLRGLYVRHHFSKAGVLSVHAGWPLPTTMNRGGSIEIGNCGLYPGVRIECWKGAVITIGNGTFINRNAEIVAALSVAIGRDCMIARDVLIMDTDQHPVGAASLTHSPINIGDRVWIGSRAIILKGVTLGHDSIVGAGAIVTKSIPPHSVVVGQAARVIRTFEVL
jgi:acetyltransferase-like isoleucine patch superfamily enzyme